MSDEYDLVMPFVVCQSKGGLYDDEAYVAGWEAGKLDLMLEMKCPTDGGTFRPDWPIHDGNRDQFDLIAMRHGCVAEFEDAGEGWSYMTIREAADG